MPENTEKSDLFIRAVDYLKTSQKTSPTRYQFIKKRVVEELKRVGFGEFTDEQAKEILDKVDQK